MCEGCYWKYTSGVDPAVTDEMVRARGLVDEVYASQWGADTGGPLHVIVDDMNVGDEFFEDEKVAEERDWIERGFEEMLGRADGYDDAAKDLCLRLYEALRGMTEAERAWVTRWRFDE